MAAKGGKKTSKVKSKKRTFEKDPKIEDSPKKKKANIVQDLESQLRSEFGDLLTEKYGVQFPDDFFWMQEFVSQDENDDILEVCNINLTGPFDFLNGKISKDTQLSKIQLHLHGRHYTDSPEMCTVMSSSGKNRPHIAYFRDYPKELPSLVVCCKDENNGELISYGDNLFAGLFLYIKDLMKQTKDGDKLKQLKKFSENIQKRSKELGYSLDSNSLKVKERSKKIVAKSLNKTGIVVSVDKTGVGYRELHHSDRDLKKLLTRIVEAKNQEEKDKYLDELQETITFVQFANDECDYGMGFELGIDLFVFGHDTFKGMISHLLPLAYQLLRRDLYAEILEAQLENRKRPGPISMLTDGNEKRKT